jgi:hypothetical protein
MYVFENKEKCFTTDSLHNYKSRDSGYLNTPAVRLSNSINSHKYNQNFFLNKILSTFVL